MPLIVHRCRTLGRVNYRSDAIVVGGGIAGICAALELLEGGMRVLLLDRDEETAFGGLAREAFGGIFVVGSPEQRRAGFRDTPEAALADWVSFGELPESEHWPRAWASAYVHRSLADVRGWLKERGVGFFPIPHWVERGERRRGNSAPRFHLVWGTGQELASVLARALRTHRNAQGLTLKFGHRVEELVTGAGADPAAGASEVVIGLVSGRSRVVRAPLGFWGSWRA